MKQKQEKSVGQLVLAVIVGVVVQGLIVFAVQWLGGVLFPLPAGMDASNSAQLADYMQSGSMPIGALLMVVFSYIAGAFGGAYTATKLAPKRGLVPALTVGQIALVFVLINLFTISHPIWMMIVSVIVPVPAAWAGGRAAGARARKR